METLPKTHKIMLDSKENKAKEERIGHRDDWTGRKGDKINSITLKMISRIQKHLLGQTLQQLVWTCD